MAFMLLLAICLTLVPGLESAPPRAAVFSERGQRADRAGELADDVRALIAEYDAEYAAWYERYLETSGANQAQLPSRTPIAERLLERIAADPGADAAFEACQWCLHPDASPAVRGRALERIASDHAGRPEAAALALELSIEGEATLSCLRAVIASERAREEPALAREALGKLCHKLARGLIARLSDPALTPEAFAQSEREAEALLELCAAEFGDLPGDAVPSGTDQTAAAAITLGQQVERSRFELRWLVPGRRAPEIEAEDLDGELLRLSDHRGRVVLLEFWGHW